MAAAFGIGEHALKAIVVLEHIDILEGDLSPGEIRTGSRGVGSEILAENENLFRH
jgi:hypothetical protein